MAEVLARLFQFVKLQIEGWRFYGTRPGHACDADRCPGPSLTIEVARSPLRLLTAMRPGLSVEPGAMPSLRPRAPSGDGRPCPEGRRNRMGGFVLQILQVCANGENSGGHMPATCPPWFGRAGG